MTVLTVNEIANKLIGTASNDFLDERDAFTKEQAEEFDSIVFCCDQCGWWFSTDELNYDDTGSMICDECSEENN